MRQRWAGGAARTARSAPLQFSLLSARGAQPGWDVRISRRARRLSMRVFPGGRVEVVVPPGVGIPAIEWFVARHRDWAERRSREFALATPSDAESRPEHVTLAASAQAWSIGYEAGWGRRVWEHVPGELRVRVADPANPLQVSAMLLGWLLERASSHLGPLLAAVSNEIGIDCSELQLRRQRTRWGSCSASGGISLNVCLMFQRPEVVRYLLIHELCHRRHMNHSARFWRLVERFEPQWQPLDAELLAGWRRVPAWVFP
jgi:predicted metal-dependent hydrolase